MARNYSEKGVLFYILVLSLVRNCCNHILFGETEHAE